jgi:hypothetical protein
VLHPPCTLHVASIARSTFQCLRVYAHITASLCISPCGLLACIPSRAAFCAVDNRDVGGSALDVLKPKYAPRKYKQGVFREEFGRAPGDAGKKGTSLKNRIRSLKRLLAKPVLELCCECCVSSSCSFFVSTRAHRW